MPKECFTECYENFESKAVGIHFETRKNGDKSSPFSFTSRLYWCLYASRNSLFDGEFAWGSE